MRWVYAGELGPGGALDWGKPPSGNLPEAGLVPDLIDTELYLCVRRLAWAGKFDGRDPDFDASAIKVNGVELRALLERVYAERASHAELKPYFALAERLGSHRQVALVAVAI